MYSKRYYQSLLGLCCILFGIDFFPGLQSLHEITSSTSYRLRVDLEDWEGNRVYAEYE